MRFVVIGAGAIGGLVGARLTQAGEDVVLVARGEHAAVMARDGLRVETPLAADQVPVTVVAGEDLRLSPGDVVLLGVKGQDTPDALDLVRAAAGDVPVPVVCLQNGVDNERVALRRVPDVYGVVVYCPSVHLKPGLVQASAAPTTGILDVGRYPAGVDAVAEALAAAFERATFASIARPDVMRWKYGKLLANLSNAVEAACGRTEEAGPLRARVRAEGEATLAAAGIDHPAAAEEEARRSGVLTFGAVPGAPRAGSSTWQSLARGVGAGARSAEADQLNGEVVLLGRLHGVPTPANALMQATVQAMARGGEPPGSRSPAALLATLDARR